ncbi:MAG: hypothetical protein IJ409_05165 [Lachnospiraceae bacterium]|nr:hypothetical protein [Lachnospiraceae bacterium]
MDIKEKVTEVVEKIKKDPELLAEFQKDPVKAVEKVVGMDLPDELIEKVVEGIKKGDIKEGMDIGDIMKKLF